MAARRLAITTRSGARSRAARSNFMVAPRRRWRMARDYGITRPCCDVFKPRVAPLQRVEFIDSPASLFPCPGEEHVLDDYARIDASPFNLAEKGLFSSSSPHLQPAGEKVALFSFRALFVSIGSKRDASSRTFESTCNGWLDYRNIRYSGCSPLSWRASLSIRA